MAKHTPGPWKLDGGTGKKGERYVWTDRGEKGKGYIGTHEVCLATVGGKRLARENRDNMDTLEEIIKADATVIAAAPGLLEACKMLLFYYEAFRDSSPNGPTELEDIESAKQTILKATS
jgi:hypothetical protein